MQSGPARRPDSRSWPPGQGVSDPARTINPLRGADARVPSGGVEPPISSLSARRPYHAGRDGMSRRTGIRTRGPGCPGLGLSRTAPSTTRPPFQRVPYRTRTGDLRRDKAASTPHWTDRTWCPERDSNAQHTGSEPMASTVGLPGHRGRAGTRTPYLLFARQALYLVSYKPMRANGRDRTDFLRRTRAAHFLQCLAGNEPVAGLEPAVSALQERRRS